MITVSGLRGIVGESLDPLRAITYCNAYLSLLDRGAIVLTRDGRTTGPMLAQAISSGIAAAGFDVLNGDVAATPTTGVLVRQHQAAGGIQISASHNPPEYNGIKLFGPDGRVIPAGQGERVIEAYRAAPPSWLPYDRVGATTDLEDTIGHHLEQVLATVDVEAIRKKNYKVVLDSNHGAGSRLGQPLLSALGCRAEIIGSPPHGRFAHPPEPTQANLAGIADAARSAGADVVFCQDPDADRLAVIDEQGNYIGEEYTLAITADWALSQRPGPLVINCSSSRMSADIAERYDCPLHLSAVGEANVTDKMIEHAATFGGEGNGGPIDPRVGYVRDSFVGMAQILDAMAAHGQTVSQLVAGLPAYQIHKTTIPVDRAKVPELYQQLQSEFPEAATSSQDGLRLDWPDRWMLVRPSNTEPIVRAIAEAKTGDQAESLCETARQLANRLS
ncbi:MAG: phosphoglucosamine mutase [Mariniblastus sp.]|nr:phosphoglucosamine mutase [Mariniblastus sp.]